MNHEYVNVTPLNARLILLIEDVLGEEECLVLVAESGVLSDLVRKIIEDAITIRITAREQDIIVPLTRRHTIMSVFDRYLDDVAYDDEFFENKPSLFVPPQQHVLLADVFLVEPEMLKEPEKYSYLCAYDELVHAICNDIEVANILDVLTRRFARRKNTCFTVDSVNNLVCRILSTTRK